ncbi:hypothetical protein M3212_09270 [Alkalihalobacillus oceani]|uniref:Uncharacterized protein n=2 Tax=Halalkalibacter oceani TaxID=1653776 RepID=A0A9X2DU99_9BACI|nr:CBO0543 family protein [Halalkalibacter oceani]MCM3715647.1 hypothetical protein [Halalkalibacter oceani]MCM3760976.1 hypothetical protein [Halalkalibacter oceani]
MQIELTKAYKEYWKLHSGFDAWQFWFNLALLIIPLIVLYFKIDKKRAFLLGFYGFNIHVWITYIDSIGIRHGFWGYPHQILVEVSSNLGLDASLVPVSFMLMYQWTLKHNKNYYLYAILLAAVFSFICKPIFIAIGLLRLYEGTLFYMFFLYIVVLLFSKFITNVFIMLRKKAE